MKLEMYRHEHGGKLITFCGLDGCGKSTMINKLQEQLRDNGYKVFVTKQPTNFVRTTEIFRNYMDTPVHESFDYRALSLLCASDRVQHSNKVIARKLEEEYIVISDRYFYSCIANLFARGFEKDTWIFEIARSVPKPDISFFLDVPTEIAISRVRSREDEKDRYIDVDLQERLRNLYLRLANDNDGVVLSTLFSEEKCFNDMIRNINDKTSINVQRG